MKHELLTYLKNNNLLWSYDVSDKESIPDDILIEQVLIYGGIEEIDLLKQVYSIDKLISIFKQNIRSNRYYENASAYIAFDLLGENEPYTYLSKYYEFSRRRDSTRDIRELL